MADRVETIWVEDSLDRINDLAYENGWTDGLPIVPPTPERVEAMVAASGRPPHEVVAVLPPRMAEATVERLAANAVMAGCRPAHFPVVLAAVAAVADPRFELFGVNTTTNPVVPMLVVNGPIRHTLDFNFSYGVFGPGRRANATVGRALSLIMLNVAGRVPGEVCKSTQKQPGAYTMCIAEHEELSPWEPLHVERGFDRATSTVTAIPPTGTINVVDNDSSRAEDLLTTIAGSMLVAGSNNIYHAWGLGEMALVLSPEHARLIAADFSKQEVKAWLHEHAAIALSVFPPHKRVVLRDRGIVQEDSVKVLARPDQLLVVVAGAPSGIHSQFIPTYGQAWAVTRPIQAG